MYRLPVIFALLSLLSSPVPAEQNIKSIGEPLFRESCAFCHGATGQGGEEGPSLISDRARRLSAPDLINLIKNGRPNKGMPGFELNDATRFLLAGYVKFLQAEAVNSVDGNPENASPEQAAIARGLSVFKGSGRCFECHSVNDEGGISAPDLSQIGDRLNKEQLLEAIQEPSRSIAQGYGASEVVLLDGTTIRGRVREETKESLQIFYPDEMLWTTYFQHDLKSRRRLETSLMPEGLLTALSQDERDDLLVFLSNQTE